MMSAGQVFQRTADLLREAEQQVATLEMGPFAVPLTPEQREGIDGFIRAAVDQALPVVHVKSEHLEQATVVIHQRRV